MTTCVTSAVGRGIVMRNVVASQRSLNAQSVQTKTLMPSKMFMLSAGHGHPSEWWAAGDDLGPFLKAFQPRIKWHGYAILEDTTTSRRWEVTPDLKLKRIPWQ